MLTAGGRYGEIRSLYIAQLASVWVNSSTTETTTCASFDKKIESFSKGELEHATEMLSALWGIISKDGEIKAPSSISPAVSLSWSCLLPYCTGMLTSHDQIAQVVSPAHWAAVKVALIKSIGKGVFFDRKYWTRNSKPGGVLKPVYFSSTIMGDKVQQLKVCASKFVYGFTAALIVASGNQSQGPKHSRVLPSRSRKRL
jgi:hypothetical protein